MSKAEANAMVLADLLTRKQRLLLERLPDDHPLTVGLLLTGGEKRTAQSLVDRRLARSIGPDHFIRTAAGRDHVVPAMPETVGTATPGQVAEAERAVLAAAEAQDVASGQTLTFRRGEPLIAPTLRYQRACAETCRAVQALREIREKTR